ncbi:hypothetical protein AOL_s00004g599 [Orbilia oligospora ATCC 24927]|uniref:Mid2 domain-containing protein n=1 Tax=Arthrobotrys oligospora (strain ATCC 24927 / CBS 115.81 / DSM 1491) TaxID=756982 RepID=G1WZ88_ARTOA|nr:hypothetical protein AOL_s00004g599 [Orbilia oligospora ATCC 24927]EGX53940.1 hypothetical protein AOL_s00004g599 [Orbilia oligospora ATCC 24927]
MRLLSAPFLLALSLTLQLQLIFTPTTFALIITKHTGRIAIDAFDVNKHPTLQQALLLKRQSNNSSDVCNQAFPGRYSETCQPNSISNTLCCALRSIHVDGNSSPKLKASSPTRPVPNASPSLDTASVAPSTNHASPTSPAPAEPPIVSNAIPMHVVQVQFTGCATNFNHTRELVRCEIRPELIPEVVFGTTRLVSGSARSTTTTAPASTLSTQTSIDPGITSSDISTATSELNSGSSETPPLNGGAIAGIVVGAILALLIGVGIGWLVFNQRACRYDGLRLPPLPPAAQFNPQQGNRQFDGVPYTISRGFNGYQMHQYKPPSVEAQELPSRPEAMELQGQANT